MGSTKTETTNNSTTSATSQATMTEAERQMQELQLAQYKQVQPGQTQMFQNAYGLGNQLLTSFGDQNGDMWKSLIGGITDEQTQSMITEQQRYLDPKFQSQGIYDSGMAYTGKLRAATDLANQNAQFNVGTLQNALNLALSGQAQIQAPFGGAASQLGSQLAGLRTVTQTGSSSGSTSQSSNPFLNSFYSSFGSSLGSGTFGKTKGWMG